MAGQYLERFDGIAIAHRRSLTWVLDNPYLMLFILLLTVVLNAALFIHMPKGFFPSQDTGAITMRVQGPQDSSYAAMLSSIQKIGKVINDDPAVANAIMFTGGGGATNGGFIYIALKPLDERKISAAGVIDRLRPKLNRMPVSLSFRMSRT